MPNDSLSPDKRALRELVRKQFFGVPENAVTLGQFHGIWRPSSLRRTENRWLKRSIAVVVRPVLSLAAKQEHMLWIVKRELGHFLHQIGEVSHCCSRIGADFAVAGVVKGRITS
jgi:hypothetical protein